MVLLQKTLIAFLSITTLSVATVQAEDAREIMRQVLDRNDGTTEISQTTISTCRYTKKGKKTVCAEKPRVKILENVRKDYGPREKDHKSIAIILSPPGEKGIGFLQYDYEAQGKETDQWMYLSALGKVKRIISGNEDEPKTGSFFGSEISYEDMEARNLKDYTYKILAHETYQKRACWVIEILPTPQRARKSNYSKFWSWVDKERFLVLKEILYNRSGKRVKRVTMRKVEQIDGIWLARQSLVNNLESRRMSVLQTKQVAFNIPVEEDFLTQRTLTDGAFREGRLIKLRDSLK